MFGAVFLKKLMILFILTLICTFTACTSFAADVEFRWAILADNGEKLEGLDFSEASPVVHSGTPLQIYLEHLNNCHIYLYLLDSSEDLTPLYPSEKGYYNYGFPRGPKYIPPGTQSFTFVPPTGTETIFLIASVDRLFQVEKLTEEFLHNSGSLGQQKLLLQELEAIIEKRQKKSKHSEDIERVDRKIRTENGVVDVYFNGVEVDISDSYGRKLLIDHR